MLHIQEGSTQTNPPAEIPAVVRALAAASADERCPDPKPIKWRMSRPEDEGEGMIVVIFEHGPTRMFTEEQVSPRITKLKSTPTVIDTTDGVDNQEASAAGKALQARRKPKP